jgi:hypothetical protein
MRKLSWLVCSLLLHLLLAFSLLDIRSESLPVSSSQIVQIDFAPAQEISKKASPAGKVRGGKKASTVTKSLFSQDYTENIGAKVEGESVLDEGRPSSFSDGETYAFDASSYLGNNDRWSFFQQVFERIDGHLLFNSILAQYNHFGSVFVEFTVDEKGRFVEKRMRVVASDPILKVHVLRALKLSLKEEFRQEKWNPTGHTELIKAKFEFVLADGSLNFQKQKDFGKPVFLFRRATEEKPIATNLKDHLLTGGGIGTDPIQVYERWEKYNQKLKSREHEFDPFGAYRTDPLYKL